MSIGIKNICIEFFFEKNGWKALLHRFCSIISQKLQSLCEQSIILEARIFLVLLVLNLKTFEEIMSRGKVCTSLSFPAMSICMFVCLCVPPELLKGADLRLLLKISILKIKLWLNFQSAIAIPLILKGSLLIVKSLVKLLFVLTAFL